MSTRKNDRPETLKERWRRLCMEYAPSDNIMDGDDTMAALKMSVFNLPQTDRLLMLLYADCGSLREVGHLLGVSHMTVRREIQRITKEILGNEKLH